MSADLPTRSASRPRMVLATTILASSLAFIDGSVVNVSLPSIGRSLHADDARLQWVVSVHLFASRSFIGLSLLTLFLYGALGGMFVLLPYVLIESAHYSSTAAGAALLPFPFVLAIVSPRMGAVVAKIGARAPLAIGSFVVGVGFLLMRRIGGDGTYVTTVLPALLVVAIGMSGAVAPLTSAVLASVDSNHTGAASGLNSALARTGGLVATALLGSILAMRGIALDAAFHLAAFVGAALCLASCISAFTLLRRERDA